VSRAKKNRSIETQIDENLRRIFDEDVEQDLPDRLRRLVDELDAPVKPEEATTPDECAGSEEVATPDEVMAGDATDADDDERGSGGGSQGGGRNDMSPADGSSGGGGNARAAKATVTVESMIEPGLGLVAWARRNVGGRIGLG